MCFVLLKKYLACCLAILLMAPASQAFASAQSATQNGPETQNSAPAANPSDQAQPPAVQPRSNVAQAGSDQQPLSKPVGTAVAPYEKSTGITGSRPAGAVIAPAKQRRMRSILIKIGLVVGAAAAVGTVVALSHASPSQPR